VYKRQVTNGHPYLAGRRECHIEQQQTADRQCAQVTPILALCWVTPPLMTGRKRPPRRG